MGNSTSSMSKHDLQVRFFVFGSLGALGVTGLSIAGCVAVYKKSGQLAVGPLSLRSNGIYWGGKLLCCGSSPAYRKVNTDPSATSQTQEQTQIRLASAGEEVALEVRQSKISKYRKHIVGVLFVCYVVVSIGIPILNARHVSCKNGFFWEDHAAFCCIFVATKAMELVIYAMDPTIQGELSFLDFFFKFMPSFLGYADGYTDALAMMIAHSCDMPEAQLIALLMLITYTCGVVILQWVIVAYWSAQEPSGACLMKLVHMDALASCVTIPPEAQQVWKAVNFARTIGEDIPQAILQVFFIWHVQKNLFMMLSVAVSVGSSVKALHDAISRALTASGAEHKREQEAFERQLVRVTASGSHDELRKLIEDNKTKFTLSTSYDVTAGITPLMLAAASNDEEASLILQNAGAQTDDMTLRLDNLPAAFAAGDLAEVVRQIAAGADVNTRLSRGEGIIDSSSGVPLHACCRFHRLPGAYEVVVLLLRCRADSSIGDAEGDTPLAHAKYYRAEALYALLDANGAELAGPFYRRFVERGRNSDELSEDSEGTPTP